MVSAFIIISGKVSLLNIKCLSAIDSPKAGIQKVVWEDMFRSCKSNLLSISSLLPMTFFVILLWLSFSDSLTSFIVDGCRDIWQHFFKLKPSVCTSFSLLPSCVIVDNGRLLFFLFFLLFFYLGSLLRISGISRFSFFAIEHIRKPRIHGKFS